MEVDTPPEAVEADPDLDLVQVVNHDHDYALPAEIEADHDDHDDYENDLEDHEDNEEDDPNENMEALLVQEAALDLELFAEQEQEEGLDLGEFEVGHFFPIINQGYYSATEE